MTTNEKLGWQLSGLMAGMTVSVLLVFACFGLAIYFSGGVTDSSAQEQALVAR